MVSPCFVQLNFETDIWRRTCFMEVCKARPVDRLLYILNISAAVERPASLILPEVFSGINRFRGSGREVYAESSRLHGCSSSPKPQKRSVENTCWRGFGVNPVCDLANAVLGADLFIDLGYFACFGGDVTYVLFDLDRLILLLQKEKDWPTSESGALV